MQAGVSPRRALSMLGQGGSQQVGERDDRLPEGAAEAVTAALLAGGRQDEVDQPAFGPTEKGAAQRQHRRAVPEPQQREQSLEQGQGVLEPLEAEEQAKAGDEHLGAGATVDGSLAEGPENELPRQIELTDDPARKSLVLVKSHDRSLVMIDEHELV